MLGSSGSLLSPTPPRNLSRPPSWSRALTELSFLFTLSFHLCSVHCRLLNINWTLQDFTGLWTRESQDTAHTQSALSEDTVPSWTSTCWELGRGSWVLRAAAGTSVARSIELEASAGSFRDYIGPTGPGRVLTLLGHAWRWTAEENLERSLEI